MTQRPNGEDATHSRTLLQGAIPPARHHFICQAVRNMSRAGCISRSNKLNGVNDCRDEELSSSGCSSHPCIVIFLSSVFRRRVHPLKLVNVGSIPITEATYSHGPDVA